MSSKLSSLVEATNDPQLLAYVWMHLGKGVPPDQCFMSTILHMRRKVLEQVMWGNHRHPLMQMKQQQVQMQRQQMALWRLQMERMQRKQMEMLKDQLDIVRLNVQERDLATQLFKQSTLNLFLTRLSDAGPDVLRRDLQDKDPLVRLLVILAIGRRHLHLENDLIDRLKDPHPAVRDAARRSLMRVTRGTDLGPMKGTSRKGIEKSIERWRQWLALQDQASEPAAPAASVVRKPDVIDLGKAIRVVLEPEDRVLETMNSTVARLSDELVQARGDKQLQVLERLRDSKGVDHTDALAQAIPRLSGEVQDKARDALAQRLTRMKAATLRDKLQDDSVEVRRAAVVACARKKATEHVLDLVPLLDDPEAVVVRAARSALKELTGEDLGWDGEAWRRWWQERQGSRK